MRRRKHSQKRKDGEEKEEGKKEGKKRRGRRRCGCRFRIVIVVVYFSSCFTQESQHGSQRCLPGGNVSFYRQVILTAVSST